MSSFKIKGGISLKGEVTPMPNKNAILKTIPACVLADEPVVLKNVPKSSSVRVMLRIFKDLGGKVTYLRDKSLKLNPTEINKHIIDGEIAKSERAVFLFLGPLLSRFGEAEIGDSGGCKLGNRPLDAMFQGLKALRVTIDKGNGYKMETKGLVGNEKMWLVEASVTGTETIILAAVKAKGKTVIYNAACEPHTQDLCNFLVSIGAKITGIGSNKLIIEGVEKLHGGEWSIIPDHIDIAGYIVAAAITGGEILIKDAIPEHMTQILNYYAKLDLKVEIRDQDIFVPGNQKLVCKKNIKGNIDKIMDQPWPGYPVDLIPQAVVLAMMSEGNIKVFGNMYETQLLFISELLKMKGELMLADSHQILTFGPSKLAGTTVDATSILQCAHAIVLAALAAEGETIIRNADIVSRRFPDIIEKLSSLGAEIEKVR